MPRHQTLLESAPDWVAQLANEFGLGLVPWTRLVCQTLQLAAQSCGAAQALFVQADRRQEHLLLWPELQFLSYRGSSELSSESALARGGFFYSREEMQLSLPDHPWINSQPQLQWCAGRSLPAPSGSRLGSIVVAGTGTGLSAPAVQERLRAAVGLLAAAITGRPSGVEPPGANLMNRREFDLQLSRETRRSERSGQPLGILLASLTSRSRKQAATDAEVQRLGEAIARLLRRGGDFTARYGSRSVAILLPDSDTPNTAGTAGMLNAALAPLLVEFNATRSAPLALKLVTTSLRGFAGLEAPPPPQLELA